MNHCPNCGWETAANRWCDGCTLSVIIRGAQDTDNPFARMEASVLDAAAEAR